MKLFFTSLLLALLVFSSPATAQANPNDFSFSSFDAVYELGRKSNGVGTLLIEERLVAEFPDYDQNRGILRSMPQDYKGNSLKLEILSVTNDQGAPWNYQTFESNDQLVLQIGDESIYVTGQQVYNIEYRVSNVISFYDDYQELFWDINGDGWLQSFDQVSAKFIIPGTLAKELQDRQVCYTGNFGSTNSDCQLNRQTQGDGVIITANAEQLGSYQTLSVALAFDQGTFKTDPLESILNLVNTVGLFLVPVSAMAFSFLSWRRNGRDVGRREVVVPQYHIPEEFDLISAELIYKEKLSPSGISAQILALAIKGNLKIIQEEKKKLFGKDNQYTIEFVHNHNLNKNQQKVIDMLFKNPSAGDRVNLNNSKSLYRGALNIIQDVPKSRATKKYFISNPTKARQLWLLKSSAVILLGIFIVILTNGRFTMLAMGLVVAGILMLFWINAMPARNKHGSRTYEHLLGIKEYIKLAEQDRLKFHQSPEGAKYGSVNLNDKQVQLNLYEHLLPYALLFGLAKEWSNEFSDVYSQQPEWYSTNSDQFNTALLANNLGQLNSTAASAFTPPSSSSSSGGSGFSGGFSGGGGGGGGGGGW